MHLHGMWRRKIRPQGDSLTATKPLIACAPLSSPDCEGGTLAQAIRARGIAPFETSQVLRWLAQLAAALSYMHDECVLHRDLKTANVFLSKGGDIK